MSKAWRWKRWLAGLVIGVLVLIIAYVQRDFLLAEIGKAWAVNSPVNHADAIVILGGGLDNRPEAAANLYQSGVAPLILFMNVKLTPAEKMGIIPTESEVTRRLLLSNSVPEIAVENIGTNISSTFDEACAVRTWVATNRAKSIEIVTDMFHTRRARWVFQQELKGTGIQIHLFGVPTQEYGANDWWKHEEGVIAFQNEVVKYVYYRFTY